MEQNSLDGYSPSKRGYWKFVIIFIVIVALAIGGFFVWNRYFSHQAKLNRQNAENLQKYLDFEANYEKALTEDTFGGKTPEETLNMFIDALQKGDIGLASKYFYLNTNERSEYYLTRREWEDGLKKTKEDGKLKNIIDKLLSVKLTFKDDDGAIFKTYGINGEVSVLIEIKFNKYSGVWKIESM